MQKHYLECHRTGDIGPFSLEAYEDVVGWADTSLEVIDNGCMPPWHADPKHGSFANAREMSEADKQVLRDWVAAGAPKGDVTDLPEPVRYAQGWQIGGEPDLVVNMRNRPYVVPAEGVIEYQYFGSSRILVATRGISVEFGVALMGSKLHWIPSFR